MLKRVLTTLKVVVFVGTKSMSAWQLEVALVGVVQLKVAAEERVVRMDREAGMRERERERALGKDVFPRVRIA